MDENKQLASEVAQIKQQVSEMHSALVGNRITKDGGLVARVKAMEEKQDEQDKFLQKLEKKLNALAIYMKLVWASAGSVATAIFSLIIKK